MRRVSNIIVLTFAALAMTHAQGTNGHVKGEVWYRPFIEKRNVFDNVVLPNCEITFRSKSLQRKVVTDAGNGSYAVDLPAGTYGATTLCRMKEASNWEFYSAGRSEFELKPNSDTMLNLKVLIKQVRKTPASQGPSEPEYRSKDSGSEIMTVKSRKVLIRYTRRLSSRDLAEYQGKRDYRQDAPVSVTSDVLAIYADSVTVEKPLMHFKASGHVTVEDGKQRRMGTEATIEFDAPDPIATLKITN